MDTTTLQPVSHQSDDSQAALQELTTNMNVFNAAVSTLESEWIDTKDEIARVGYELQKDLKTINDAATEFEQQHGSEAEASVLGIIEAEDGSSNE